MIALSNVLTESYNLESNNRDKKMKLLLLFFIVASIELMKALWFPQI